MCFLAPAFGFTERVSWTKRYVLLLRLCFHAVWLTPDLFALENVPSLGCPCRAGSCNPSSESAKWLKVGHALRANAKRCQVLGSRNTCQKERKNPNQRIGVYQIGRAEGQAFRPAVSGGSPQCPVPCALCPLLCARCPLLCAPCPVSCAALPARCPPGAGAARAPRDDPAGIISGDRERRRAPPQGQPQGPAAAAADRDTAGKVTTGQHLPGSFSLCSQQD